MKLTDTNECWNFTLIMPMWNHAVTLLVYTWTTYNFMYFIYFFSFYSFRHSWTRRVLCHEGTVHEVWGGVFVGVFCDGQSKVFLILGEGAFRLSGSLYQLTFIDKLSRSGLSNNLQLIYAQVIRTTKWFISQCKIAPNLNIMCFPPMVMK